MTASKFSRRKAGLPHVIPGLNRHLRRPSQPAPYSETLEPNWVARQKANGTGTTEKQKAKFWKEVRLNGNFHYFSPFTPHRNFGWNINGKLIGFPKREFSRLNGSSLRIPERKTCSGVTGIQNGDETRIWPMVDHLTSTKVTFRHFETTVLSQLSSFAFPMHPFVPCFPGQVW